MKHYLVLVEKEEVVSAGPGNEIYQPVGQNWHNRYTISAPDDDIDFSLRDYVNGLVFAEQFLTPSTAWIERVIVLEYEPDAPFSATTTTAHLFSDGVLWRAQGMQWWAIEKQVGLTGGGDIFVGLAMAQNRREGDSTKKLYRGCYSQFDRSAWPQKQPAKIPILRSDGPLYQYWQFHYQFLLDQLPYVDSVADIDCAGEITPYQTREGPPLAAYASHLATERRKRARMHQREWRFEECIERALDQVQWSLERYEQIMWSYDHQWGDGHMPGGGTKHDFEEFAPPSHWGGFAPGWLHSFALAAGVWEPLAFALGVNVGPPLPDMSLVGLPWLQQQDEMRNWTRREFDALHVQLAGGEAAVLGCLQRLYALDKFYRESILPLMNAASQAKPYPQWPQERALELYKIWNEITAWIFDIKSVLCVLYSVANLKIPRRSAPHINKPQPAAATFAGLAKQTWHVDWQTWLPIFREILPFSREPFLTLNPLPDATVAIALAPPPQPRYTPRMSERQRLHEALKHLTDPPTKEQMCEFINILKMWHDIILDPADWLMKAILSKILSWLGIEYNWELTPVPDGTGAPPPPPKEGEKKPKAKKGWKLNVDWLQMLIDYECSAD